MVSSALKNLVLDGYVRLHPTSSGYRYSLLESGKTICTKLTSGYAKEYILAIQSVVDRFDKADAAAMLKEINRLTIQSLQEVGHE